jgi:phage shock protein C
MHKKDSRTMDNRFVLNRREAKIMGVGAGLADMYAIDPLVVRLGLVAALLLLGPVAILFYVLTGWLAADR